MAAARSPLGEPILTESRRKTLVTPANAGARRTMDPGLRREDGRRTPRVTSVKFGPRVVRIRQMVPGFFSASPLRERRSWAMGMVFAAPGRPLSQACGHDGKKGSVCHGRLAWP